MKRVTLNGINRRGLSNWKAREWWCRQRVIIWSQEHCAWWRQDAAGYTTDANAAGVYEFADAYDRTKHCGPEKRIGFYATRALTPSLGDRDHG